VTLEEKGQCYTPLQKVTILSELNLILITKKPNVTYILNRELIKLVNRNGKLKHRQTKENGKGNKVETCWLRKRNKTSET
jgi:hypothetical protein